MSVKDFLKQRAVNISVGGHYTLANWFDAQGKPRTFACRTSRVSPFRMLVAVPVVGKVGDRVTSYFGDFGKLDGQISDITARGFLLELAMTQAKREKLSSKLTWLEQKQKNPSIPDGRRHVRIIPANPHSTRRPPHTAFRRRCKGCTSAPRNKVAAVPARLNANSVTRNRQLLGVPRRRRGFARPSA